jgi:hypothetical protein
MEEWIFLNYVNADLNEEELNNEWIFLGYNVNADLNAWLMRVAHAHSVYPFQIKTPDPCQNKLIPNERQ